MEVKLVVMGEDADRVNPKMIVAIEGAALTMIRKSLARGDAWRGLGVAGLFSDLHTCYARIRGLIWDNPPRLHDPVWRADLFNATEDIRNYALLIEMAADDDSLMGAEAAFKLTCPACGVVIVEERADG